MALIHKISYAGSHYTDWTKIHEIKPIAHADMPDDRVDIFDAVASIEAHNLKYHNLNLIGNKVTMNATQTPMALALSKAGVTAKTHLVKPGDKKPAVTSGHAYFDPLDVIQDHLGLHDELYARLTNSLAWTLDMACNNMARNILFNRYKTREVEEGLENPFQAFCNNIAGDLAHDELYEPSENHETGETDERTLAQLIALSPQWHSMAQAAAARNNRDYDPKSRAQLLRDEKPRKLDAGTLSNYALMAKAEANGDEAKEARIVEDLKRAFALSAMDRVQGAKELIPVICLIVDLAAAHAPADVRFDQLPLTMQRRLTQNTLSALDRGLVDCARTMAKKPLEFARMHEAARNARTQLNHVLATKYNEAGELENVRGTMDHDTLTKARQAKAVAAAKGGKKPLPTIHAFRENPDMVVKAPAKPKTKTKKVKAASRKRATVKIANQTIASVAPPVVEDRTSTEPATAE